MEEQTTQITEQPTQPVEKAKNGLGMAGFIVSLIGLILFWIPVLGYLILLTGFILSTVGLIMGIVKKRKLGLAITGLVLSGVGFIASAVALEIISSNLGF